MLLQLKFFSTLSRDFIFIPFIFSDEDKRRLIAVAKSLENFSGSLGSQERVSSGSKGTNKPVSSGITTSGMPPIADATTGVPHAIASRLTIPKGSHTDGH